MKRILLSLILIVSAVCVKAQTAKENLVFQSYILVENGNYKQAVEILTPEIQRNTGPDATYFRARAFYGLRQYAYAISDFRQYSLHNPDAASIWLARCYALDSQPDSAVSFLRRHLQSAAKLPMIRLKTDSAFRNLKKTPQWEKLWEEDWYTQAQLNLNEAIYLGLQKKYNEAANILSEAEQPARYGEFYAYRAEMFRALNNPRLALQDLNRAIEIETRPDWLIMRGDIHAENKDWKKALTDYQNALSINPFQKEAILKTTTALTALKTYDQALNAIGTLLICDAENPDVLTATARVYLAQGDAIEALPLLNKAIKTGRPQSVWFEARAEAYTLTGAYSSAYNDYSMSLDLYPYKPEVYFRRALVSIEQGNTDAACYDLHKAFEMGYLQADEYIKKYCR